VGFWIRLNGFVRRVVAVFGGVAARGGVAAVGEDVSAHGAFPSVRWA
jgi:hypothetical protein